MEGRVWRRRIGSDESALSAVLAVALLIGVVILLGVAVSVMLFILVQDAPEQAPSIGFTESEDNDRWLLTTAPEDVTWSEYEIRVSGNEGRIRVALNAEAGLLGMDLQRAPQQLSPPEFVGELGGGQFLDFCAEQEEFGVTVTLVHSASEQISQSATFAYLPADPACT